MKQSIVVQILRCSVCLKYRTHFAYRRFSSSTAAALQQEASSTDQASLFIKTKVRDILKKMTGVKPEAILPRVPQKKKVQSITLMSGEQLEEFQQQAISTTKHHLQMPPVLPPRQEIDVVLSKDEGIEGFSPSTHVFTDITLGVHERHQPIRSNMVKLKVKSLMLSLYRTMAYVDGTLDRTIVVREADGTLRLAPWDVRDRISQVYYPRSGRKVKPAAMFQSHNVKRLLDEQKYAYLLDNACAHFEPDHPQYIQICHQVYEHCDVNNSYSKMKFTRHYGPMLFYFVCRKQITGIMNSFILDNRVDQCVDVIQLYDLIWPSEAGVSDRARLSGRVALSEKVDHIITFLKSKNLLTYDMESELQQYLDEQEELSVKHLAEDSTDSDSNSSSSSSSSSDSDTDTDK